MNNNALSIIIRTMPGREKFLDKCLFLLTCQTYSEIEPIIVIQKKQDSDSTNHLTQTIQVWKNSFPKLQVITHTADYDARALSLNLGKKAATGRFLAFLDDDDKVYPEHYSKLIDPLLTKEYVWAYSDIIQAYYNEYGQLTARNTPFKRDHYSFLNHLKGNFIPIHSFVLDLTKVDSNLLVDESFTKHEDYDFLLRLAFKHEPLYIPSFTAEYCIRTDGSNTIMDGTSDTVTRLKKLQGWMHSHEQLEQKKVTEFGWWVKEFDSLQINAPFNTSSQNFSYRQALADYYNSSSWRMTRLLRNLIRSFKNMPKEQICIPHTEVEAKAELDKLLRSTSWEITAPLRLFSRVILRKK
ncbi:glycosyltransferase family 2 protein [Acinetobacter sp. MD2]|uniref:glycosyltransferase family 2 protein n=1 Tax=Acinetobacter sp. MD2 TaxID=2600066 RepID=UPI002D1E4BB1|nr:glycosyltransferase [Acinetobacter sp. MD2]MEB3767349.1 glycosyltransferase [Acinetobacter sp. MD2]